MTLPSSVGVAAKAVAPVVGLYVSVKVALGAVLGMLTTCTAVPVSTPSPAASASVAVIVTVWSPAVANVCVTELPLSLAPSPKFHAIVSMSFSASVEVSVNVTDRHPLAGVAGFRVAVNDASGGVANTT